METPDTLQELEIFDIPGFENRYCATKDGRIYSLINNRFLTKSDDTYGYDTVAIAKGGKTRTYKVHKLIALTFLTNTDNHPHIDHINRSRKDNNINNLRYLSASENTKNRSSYKKKSPELRNIICKKSSFKVTLRRKTGNIYKSFKTLQEAQQYRDSFTPSQDSPDVL